MAEMFGGPVGTSAYDANARANMQTGVQATEALGRIAMQPDAARLLRAQAGEKEQDVADRQAMAALMKGASAPGAPGGPAGSTNPFALSDFFNQQATAAARAGLTKQAQELAKTAANLTQSEASALSSNTTARLNQLKTIKERSSLMGQLFGEARSTADWDRANAVFEFQTGQASPYAGVQYNPGLVDTIRTQAVTVKERLEAEDRRLSRELTEAHRSKTRGISAANLTIAEERLQLDKDREERLAKAGGKGAVGAATREEINETKRLMKLDGIDIDKVDPDSLGSTAFAVASRAREMQQENRALGRAAALQRAFTEMKEAGDLDIAITGGADLPIIGQVGGKRKFERDPARALPPAARSALKDNVETTFANGQTWTLVKGKPKRVK